jgi:hypothetical protein
MKYSVCHSRENGYPLILHQIPTFFQRNASGSGNDNKQIFNFSEVSVKYFHSHFIASSGLTFAARFAG